MKRLSDLTPHEVSLVPRGANKKKFLIFKSRKGNEMSKTTEIQNMINAVDAKTMAGIDKVLKGMSKMGKTKKTEGKESPGDKAMKMKKMKKMKKDMNGDLMPRKDSAAFKDAGAANQATDEGVSHAHTPLSDRAQAALKATARILAPFKDEITDDHMDAIQGELGIGSNEDEETPHDDDEGEDGDVEMSAAYPEEIEDEHHAEALDMAKKAYGAHLEKMGYRKYQDPSLEETNASKTVGKDADMDDDDEDEGEDDVSKVSKSADLSAFSQNQRGQLEAIVKSHNAALEENKVLVRKTADLEKQLKIERDERVLKGFKEQARSFKHLGADTDELAMVMKSMAETDPRSFEKIEAILKSADEQIRVGSLFGESGSRQSRSGGNAPADKLDALVDSVVAKSDGKTKEQVYDEVLKTAEGKRLYAEYKASRQHGI